MFGERENEVIKDLLNDMDMLYEENQKYNACRRWYEEVFGLEGEVRKMKAEHLAKESEVKKVQWKFKLVLLTLLLTWMLLLLHYF